MFLHERIEQAKTYGQYKEIPAYIANNINSDFELRPYQKAAFRNFITYFETPTLRQKPTQTLFHMATGSGKTLIMAGLILYLYKQGYRNFLFFVNLSNILQKTKENFLNTLSNKYLFAEDIVIDGERIQVKDVENFQNSDSEAINICFTTIQGLHMDMWMPKENGLSLDDFHDKKIVLISDEAHHLNVSTKKMSKEEQENYKTWESTVNNIFAKNNDNILLEFTATCDIANPQIKNFYESRIVFDYPLKNFREDLYSKEIITLRSDMPTIMDRALQALMLSQYRLKVFQDNKLSIKPVILFKSATIADSEKNMADFFETIKNLTGATLERISGLIQNKTMNRAYSYFVEKNITFENLAQELKEDFSAEHCISANDDKNVEQKQIILNSLEAQDNPYRAVFEVKKLDEGWDVLNLFDIVRLYETRQSSGRKISPATISEAQLIGRGARYCPFQIDPEQPKYQRKYDNDVDNELRICEELYYHCQNDSRYIGELHQALREKGIDLDKIVTRQYILKDSFKNEEFYKKGYIFINERLIKSRTDVNGLLPSVREKIYSVEFATGKSGEDKVMDDLASLSTNDDNGIKNYARLIKFSEIAKINYSLVNKALRKYKVFNFNILKSYFPNLSSTREFITGENYLGNIVMNIKSRHENLPMRLIHDAAIFVLGAIAGSISGTEETYEGSKEFREQYIHNVFKDKAVNYSDPHNGGIGVSQNDNSVPTKYKLDLSREDWFAFTDNYGTSEEKSFVAYFKDHVEGLRKKYSKVYLVRNERHFHIYSFNGGERFEPDYVLFLYKDNSDGYEQIQIFVEPKGDIYINGDKWKEDFLLQLEQNAVPVTKFVDDNKYRIWGFHFFNRNHRNKEFEEDFNALGSA